MLVEATMYLHSLKSFFNGDSSPRKTINCIFWLCCLLALLFFYFKRSLELILRRGRVRAQKHSQTIQHAWNVCFYTAATVFLGLYHKLLIRPEIASQSSKYFPQYNNAIFLTACDVAKFEIVTMVLAAFDIIGTLVRVRNHDFSEAISKVFFFALVLCCYVLRLENYSVLLNFYLGAYNAFQEALLLLSLHTNDRSDTTLRLYVILNFSSWSYLFLNILPFEFLIPTLYANNRELHLYLNIIFWLWYCSCIWNSPILKFLYHKIYHLHPYDCAGGESSVRCILLNDNQRFKHYRNLERAYLELKLFHDKSKLSGARHGESENASAKAFQTIKCVLALKRKLKRMRENRDHLSDD
uniref:Putative conserved plasma membrane protein n=1 Tax=Culex tarsalis TaxID=7177 RepID=A0A1Q3FHU9_CULTA